MSYRNLIITVILSLSSFNMITAIGIYNTNYKTLSDSVKTHYIKTQDNEKIVAADFLLTNMRLRCIRTSEQVVNLVKVVDSITIAERTPLNNIYNTIENFYDDYDVPQIYYEYESVTASDIIHEIDKAFETWKSSKFSKHINFEDFCEYLLPPIIGNSYYTPWRDAYSEKYSKCLLTLQYSDDRCSSPFYGVSKINYELRHRGVNIKLVELPFGLSYPASSLLNMKLGTCRDYAIMSAYAMRSLGMPVGIDFVLQWPHRNGGHYWNTLLSDNGLNIPFTGAGGDPGMAFYPDSPMGKVYRMTYAYQKESLPELNDIYDENIPLVLNNSFMKDVTDEYCKTVDIKLSDNKNKENNIMYLSVFDNQNWVPIAFTTKVKDTVIFHKVGIGVVYLPCYWSKNNEVAKFTYPIEIKRNGNVHTLQPDYNKKVSMTFKRKYPKFSGILGYSNRMQGGYIEASNDSNFSHAIKVCTIEQFPDMKWNTLHINNDAKYRYWRYVSPKNGWCDIAEMEFYNCKKKKIMYKNIMASTFRNDAFSPNAAFDNDPLTYYEHDKRDGGWIGVDMGKTISVDAFHFLPRNDDNNIVPGHIYELEMYDKVNTISLGKIKSTSDSITFNNIPSNALYILHDRSKGTEERIFTIEDNKIIWY